VTSLSRRDLLALGAVGAVGVVTAGCTQDEPKNPRPMPIAPSTPKQPTTWDELADAVTGTLSRPGDEDYDTVRLVQNPRFDTARPLGVLTVASATDVATALAFARAKDVPLALRSGGHSYTGWSSGGAAGTNMPPSLVIDTRGMTDVTMHNDNTVTVQAGVSLVQLYTALGNSGRAIAAGSCATVGATGLILGGGVGVLTRAYGLSCDALTAVEIVTADGTLRTATATKDPELFWACRGGGGGHLGVVTSLTLDTQPAPNVTMFSLQWPFSSAADVVSAWQRWAPQADPRLWSTLKLLSGTNYTDGPGLFLSGTWIGPKSDLAVQLAPLLTEVGTTPTRNSATTKNYLDAMMSYAGCGTIPLAQCQTGVGGRLHRESFSATSHVPYRELNSVGIDTMLAQVVAASAVPGLREGGISMDALGGKVRDLAPGATAFPHRTALMTVQYTATFANGTDPAPYDAYVRGFRSALVPEWGDGAYVNYPDASLPDPAASYFGDNAPRLAAARAKYDPNGLFTQPQAY
jgi:FAD/FMN-containing dehydrogenase